MQNKATHSKIHLPYVSQAVARTRYEEPTNCFTDVGTELGCAQNWKLSPMIPDPFS